jgi:hypothetical protein
MVGASRSEAGAGLARLAPGGLSHPAARGTPSPVTAPTAGHVERAEVPPDSTARQACSHSCPAVVRTKHGPNVARASLRRLLDPPGRGRRRLLGARTSHVVVAAGETAAQQPLRTVDHLPAPR